MKIRNQTWNIQGEYLVLPLHDPYWSAYLKFGWPDGTEGYSISEEALAEAVKLGKKIMITNKYGKYEITSKKATRYADCKFIARDHKVLICLPKFAFKRVVDQEVVRQDPVSTANALAAMPEYLKEALRKKLHSK